jgi:deoxyribose-phosphate aldolase
MWNEPNTIPNTNITDFPKLFDHTLLKPEVKENQIRQLCDEAVKFQFASVCVNPFFVSLASEMMQNSGVKVCTVAGFPLGANMSDVKAFEAAQAIKQGAKEIDMVIPIGALIAGNYDYVHKDISRVVEVCKSEGALCKVIIETCYLTDNDKIKACQIITQSGAHFVKTSTGFGPGGATLHDVRLLKNAVKESHTLVKAAGGIRSLQDALNMVQAGADRLGTSATVKIMEEFLKQP